MNPAEIEAQVSLLHSCYCKFTKLELPIRTICDERRLGWQHYVAAGLGLKDLETVLAHLNREILAERRHRGALRFRTLILDLAHFQEELAEAQAVTRNLKPAPSPKAVVAQQFSPVVASPNTEDTARPVAKIDWIAALRAAVDNPGSVSQ